VWLAVPQPTEGQRIGNQIDAAMNRCVAGLRIRANWPSRVASGSLASLG
jgi:hypothetical protein